MPRQLRQAMVPFGFRKPSWQQGTRRFGGARHAVQPFESSQSEFDVNRENAALPENLGIGESNKVLIRNFASLTKKEHPTLVAHKRSEFVKLSVQQDKGFESRNKRTIHKRNKEEPANPEREVRV